MLEGLSVAGLDNKIPRHEKQRLDNIMAKIKINKFSKTKTEKGIKSIKRIKVTPIP